MILYKHKNNTDVAFELIKMQYRDDNRMKLKIAWWNVSSKGYEFPMGYTQKIEIKTEDWPSWEKIVLDVKNFHWGA